jgi:hypothetical protein
MATRSLENVIGRARGTQQWVKSHDWPLDMEAVTAPHVLRCSGCEIRMASASPSPPERRSSRRVTDDGAWAVMAEPETLNDE